VDRVIVWADAAGVALVGASSEAELLGRNGLEFIAEPSQAAVLARRTMNDSGQSPRSQIAVMRRVDGTERHIEISSSATTWNGRPAMLVLGRPTDDPYRLRHLVTGVFSEVSDAVIVTDPEHHVRSWNDAAERLYGWAEREVLGRHVSDVLPFVASGGDARSALATLETAGRWFGEGHHIARDGSVVNVAASTTLVRDEAGAPALIVSVNRLVRPPGGAMPSPDTALETEIRRALDSDEFIVHYQPVVAMKDEHLMSVEALVRWNHPVRGVLPPAAFMDAAERTGMIVELGRVVLDKACRQMAEWHASGFDIELAVNLSTRQLADPGLFEDITNTLKATGGVPEALWLEVTETALVEDVDSAAELLHRVAALGIRIAIDDFGTGWASLTYLKQFPVHALKIDRSFVAGIDLNPQDAAIARSILSLGEELDLLVVAEGVETMAQQSTLQALGCSVAQGYLYGKPTPAATVPMQRARHRRPRGSEHNS
jgi:PAS domain S-box-containing protein